MKPVLAFVGAIFLFGLASPVLAESLEEALAMAYTSNPQLRAERAGLRAADERLLQARAARLPTLQANASVGTTRQKQTSPFFSATQTYHPRSLALTGRQTLYGGGGIRGQIDLAQVNVEIGRNNLRELEQQVLLDTLTAYVDVRQNAEVVRIRSHSVEVLIKQLEAAQDRFTVGEITRTGVSQAKARLAGSRSQLAAARAGLANARAAYERNVGQAAGTLQDAPMPDILPNELALAVNWSDNNSPALLNSRLSELSAIHSITIAKATLRPSLSLGVDARTADDNGFIGGQSDIVSTALNLTVPLFAGGLNQSRVREAKEQASQARIGVLQAVRVSHEQVTNAWHALIASKAVIRANEEQVTANELAYEGVLQEVEIGLRTTLEALNAEQELLDARLSLISANRDTLVAAYGLLRATGRLSVTELRIDVDKYDPIGKKRSIGEKIFSTTIDE